MQAEGEEGGSHVNPSRSEGKVSFGGIPEIGGMAELQKRTSTVR